LADDLNRPNRRVRTRMPGGVAGEVAGRTRHSPMPIAAEAGSGGCPALRGCCMIPLPLEPPASWTGRAVEGSGGDDPC
jgi:hypothetical protein